MTETNTPQASEYSDRLAAPCYYESPGPKAVPQCRIDGCTATAPHGHTTSNHPEEWWCPPSEWLDDANRGIVLPNDQPTRVLPTEAEVARVIFGAQERDWRSWAHTQQEPYLKAARAVLALFASQPTVAQVKAEALREESHYLRERISDATAARNRFDSDSQQWAEFDQAIRRMAEEANRLSLRADRIESEG